jgi:hypothetical protein
MLSLGNEGKLQIFNRVGQMIFRATRDDPSISPTRTLQGCYFIYFTQCMLLSRSLSYELIYNALIGAEYEKIIPLPTPSR